MLTGTLELLLSVEDYVSIKINYFRCGYIFRSLWVLGGDDGGVATAGGDSRGGVLLWRICLRSISLPLMSGKDYISIKIKCFHCG